MENGTLSDHQGLCGHGGCGSDPRRSEWCLAVKAEGQVTTGLDDQHLPRGPWFESPVLIAGPLCLHRGGARDLVKKPASPPQPTHDGDETLFPQGQLPSAPSPPTAPPGPLHDSAARKDNTEERENKRTHEEWS
ncbi:unnamed protein product [Boreogadus saida]